MPHVLTYGFRPFFFLASLWAAAAVPLWLLAYRGDVSLAPAYGDLAWHAHELIFGYAAAAVCGFLLTSVPNWTGRPPVRGLPLLALVAVWFLGRAAMLAADAIGLAAAAALDLLFPLAVMGLAARARSSPAGTGGTCAASPSSARFFLAMSCSIWRPSAVPRPTSPSGFRSPP